MRKYLSIFALIISIYLFMLPLPVAISASVSVQAIVPAQQVLAVSNLSYSPVPFGPTAGREAFTFNLSKDATVSITIADITGAPIRILGPVSGVSGQNTIYWDGNDSSGQLVASSMYKAMVDATDTTGNSSTTDFLFTVDNTPPTVTANPGAGFYNKPVQVVLAPSENSTIYYTTDGSDPYSSSSSAIYSSPVNISTTATLKFMAVDQSYNSSQVYTETYTIDTTPPTVTADPAGSLYNNAKQVTLTPSESATIYYTLDGSTPTTNSSRYVGMPIDVLSSETLKYMAVDNAGNQSQVYTETYAIDVTPPTVSITSPASGSTVSGITQVDVSASDVGSGIDKIELYVDQSLAGTQVTQAGTGAYTFDLDTAKYSSYSHTLMARAYDIAGNYQDSQINITCSNESHPPVSTPVSDPIGDQTVSVAPGLGSSVEFAVVTTPGETKITVIEPVNIPAPIPSGYQAVNLYDMSTTASYEGLITVTFSYDPSLSPEEKATIRLLHWQLDSNGNYNWVDVTVSNDIVNNTITGRTSSLSPFAIVKQSRVSSAPVNGGDSTVNNPTSSPTSNPTNNPVTNNPVVESAVTQSGTSIGTTSPHPKTYNSLPDAPQGLELNSSGDTASLVWAVDRSGRIAGYNIYRQLQNESKVKLNSALLTDGKYVDKIPQTNVDCTYYIVAVDKQGREGQVSTVVLKGGRNPHKQVRVLGKKVYNKNAKKDKQKKDVQDNKGSLIGNLVKTISGWFQSIGKLFHNIAQWFENLL